MIVNISTHTHVHEETRGGGGDQGNGTDDPRAAYLHILMRYRAYSAAGAAGRRATTGQQVALVVDFATANVRPKCQ